MGLASWQSIYGCCTFCSLPRDEIDTCDDQLGDPDGPPWRIRDSDEYFDTCAKCEVFVNLNTEADRSLLVKSLKFTRPKRGVGGRQIVTDVKINGTSLEMGDTVAPSDSVWDVGSIERLALPLVVTMWRTRRAADGKNIDFVKHRCPVFCRELRTAPHDVLAVGARHCVYLGPAMRWCAAGAWRLIMHNV